MSAVDGAIGSSGGLYSPAALYNAGLKTKPADFTVLVLVAALLLGIVGTLIANLLLGILFAVLTPLLAKMLLSVLTDKRRSKFDAQLTDTIQMLIGGLRVGHSMMRSIDAASKEADAPTSEELARIVNETRIGKDSHEAIEEAAARMRSEDFKWVAQAIQINREVGGDLAGVLEEVAGTIRERSEIKGQIKSLSAEGKMSAYVLMALPVGVAVAFAFINPGYLNIFVEDIRGIGMLIGSLLMFALGGFWLSRIVKVRF
ncbi:type II secretion system F family protein [Arthrobacter zhaoguopingii]|uniref:type II secretion system F family protein n=1 Tax=Arthrobacter zhaoguopingii TaxID=2681491 RepID=UPI001FEF8720|nr:type II secretion system F family protein [Arthrobacter zhaoguopingii]